MPEACVAALAHAANRREWLSRPLGQPPARDGADPEEAGRLIAPALENRDGAWLDLLSALRLLDRFGISVAPTYLCETADEAAATALELDVPVVLKPSFPPPARAADLDAILLGLTGEDAIRDGWAELHRRVAATGETWPGQVIVQPLIQGGADLLLGAVTDRDLGPLIGLGAGGRQAALGQSVAFRLPPRTDADADELIAASAAAYAWLEGHRGRTPLDRLALRDLILRFAQLIVEVPEVDEVDLNPARVLASGYCVIDARVRVARPTATERIRTW